MSEPELLEVALFPIPNVVAFPGTVLPLHVFEPRYRRLVHDCIEQQRMVAVSHVHKAIHEPAKQQTLEEALSSNQTTYQPREVFSAGPCEIVETTPDGRLLAQITMTHRLLLVEERQSLPYRIVRCQQLDDDEPTETRTDTNQLRRLINDKLVDLIHTENAELAETLGTPEWTELDAGEYSFRVFQVLRFPPPVMQDMLEAPSANARLEMLWEQLRRA